ncbi:MAG: helix-turn-helix domain-containing protein [Acidobacteriota bacterium]|nr:helix-turn-helix domain-containing protein [Acidobacteriota bacterium]
MPPANPEFGRRVRELREAKRKTNPAFSLRRFAQAIGVSATFQSKVENGESPPPGADKIKRMAALLDTDADELLALAGKVDPDLPAIIREMPRAMADFLRTAREAGLTDDDIMRLTDNIKKGQ